MNGTGSVVSCWDGKRKLLLFALRCGTSGADPGGSCKGGVSLGHLSWLNRCRSGSDRQAAGKQASPFPGNMQGQRMTHRVGRGSQQRVAQSYGPCMRRFLTEANHDQGRLAPHVIRERNWLASECLFSRCWQRLRPHAARCE